MLINNVVCNPGQIKVRLDKGPNPDSSRYLHIRFESDYENDDQGGLTIVDYDTERAERLFKAISEALEPQPEKAEAA